jgi:hypothetical protein
MSTARTHIFDSDGYWGTSRFPPRALEETVTYIHFCAHSNPENEGADGQPPTNHWSLFLEIDESRSVRVDAVPGAPHTPGMIILEIKNYNITERRVFNESSAVPAGTTVETILQVIIKNGRDRYMFAPVGEGCRFWMATLATDLAGAGLVSNDMASKAVSALQCYFPFPAGSAWEVRAMQQGRFF